MLARLWARSLKQGEKSLTKKRRNPWKKTRDLSKSLGHNKSNETRRRCLMQFCLVAGRMDDGMGAMGSYHIRLQAAKEQMVACGMTGAKCEGFCTKRRLGGGSIVLLVLTNHLVWKGL